MIYAIALLLAFRQAPTLQHRVATAHEDAPPSVPQERSSLPENSDGEYQFGETGEVIELYVEEHTLRGYLLKRSEPGHAASTPLTYEFASAAGNNGALHFTTRPLHGEFYSFEGSLVRGRATTPSALGYYLLRGRLTLHQSSAVSTRTVVLERLGEH